MNVRLIFSHFLCIALGAVCYGFYAQVVNESTSNENTSTLLTSVAQPDDLLSRDDTHFDNANIARIDAEDLSYKDELDYNEHQAFVGADIEPSDANVSSEWSSVELDRSIQIRIDRVDEYIANDDIASLASLLSDEESVVRSAAIDGLELIDTEESVRLLGGVVISDKDKQVRLKALQALNSLFYVPSAEHFIRHIAKHDKDQLNRTHAKRILGEG